MRYLERYVAKATPELIRYLDEKSVKYRVTKITNWDYVIFYIYSDMKVAEEVKSFIELSGLDPIVDVSTSYSKKEMMEAELLTINPKFPKVEINEDFAFEDSCTYVDRWGMTRVHHRKQVSFAVINKEPVWRKAFYTEDSGSSQIFTNKSVCDLIQDHSLSGINFQPVLLKNGKVCENTFQLTAKHIIEKSSIMLGYGERIEKCPFCGKEQYVINNKYQLHLTGIDRGSDFYETVYIFGGGIPGPIYIISQRFYRLLIENKLDKSLVIEPVCLL